MAASDYQLLDRYAAGDESAFEELVLRHQKTVYDLAYRMLENHADAADLAQKSFVQAFLHHRSFKRERSEEHTSELQSRLHLVCRLLLEKKKKTNIKQLNRQKNRTTTCI